MIDNCLNCGESYERKRKNHKFCSNKCRTAHWKRKNGVVNPFAPNKKDSNIGSYNQPKPFVKRRLPNATSPKLYETTKLHPSVDEEVNLLQQQKNYWINVINQAQNGVLPIGAVFGAFIGAIVNGSDGENVDKVAGAAAGGTIGHLVDLLREKNKDDYINTAYNEIQRIEHRIKLLSQVRNQLIDFKNNIPQKDQKSNTEISIGDIVLDSEYLMNSNIKKLELTGVWKWLLGYLEPDSYGLITGLPKNGKTTFALKLANYLQNNHGKVLYFQSEQRGDSLTFADSIQRTGTSNKTIHKNPPRNLNKLLEIIEENQAKFVFIDSVNNMGFTAGDMRRFKEEKSFCFFGIMQSTKDGSFKGDQEFLHDCDVMIRLEKFEANITHSRYGTQGENVMLESITG